jgi:hypothetical protein
VFAWFWGLPPWAVAAVVFAIDFGAILGIRVVVERRLYVRQWWTFRYGDSVYLPLYGAFVAARLQQG